MCFRGEPVSKESVHHFHTEVKKKVRGTGGEGGRGGAFPLSKKKVLVIVTLRFFALCASVRVRVCG